MQIRRLSIRFATISANTQTVTQIVGAPSKRPGISEVAARLGNISQGSKLGTVASHNTDDCWQHIHTERLALGDLIEGLTTEELNTASLCTGWTVKMVAAHLLCGPCVSTAKFMAGLTRNRFNFDKTMDKFARELAQKPAAEIASLLRHNADHHFTPPGFGPEAPLIDLLIHGLDIRIPLDDDRTPDPAATRIVLNHLTTAKTGGFVRSDRLNGQRFVATDIDWTFGHGPEVSGPSSHIMLTLSGRPEGLQQLSGEGLPRLAGTFR